MKTKLVTNPRTGKAIRINFYADEKEINHPFRDGFAENYVFTSAFLDKKPAKWVKALMFLNENGSKNIISRKELLEAINKGTATRPTSNVGLVSALRQAGFILYSKKAGYTITNNGLNALNDAISDIKMQFQTLSEFCEKKKAIL